MDFYLSCKNIDCGKYFVFSVNEQARYLNPPATRNDPGPVPWKDPIRCHGCRGSIGGHGTAQTGLGGRDGGRLTSGRGRGERGALDGGRK